MQQVLVIEDDPDVSQVVKLILEYGGYDVHVSESGEIVDDLINQRDGHPVVILMDIFLSGSDGRELTKKLKKTTLTQHIPVVMMSANRAAHEDAKKVGADDFISKPFDAQTLLGKVKQHVN